MHDTSEDNCRIAGTYGKTVKLFVAEKLTKNAWLNFLSTSREHFTVWIFYLSQIEPRENFFITSRDASEDYNSLREGRQKKRL